MMKPTHGSDFLYPNATAQYVPQYYQYDQYNNTGATNGVSSNYNYSFPYGNSSSSSVNMASDGSKYPFQSQQQFYPTFGRPYFCA